MKIKSNFQGLNKFKPMKKIFIVILSILVILAISISAVKQSTQRPAKIQDINVNLINQEPDPAEPGNYVDVRFKFDNNGSKEARNVEVEILPEFPFSLDPGREAIKKIGTLQSMQKGDVGVIVKYRLSIDKSAIEGENEIKIRYRIDNGIWIELEEFLIDIQTLDAILAIESIITSDSIIPGKSTIVILKLKNMADSLLKDIKIKIDIDNVPLVPLGSTNEKTLYQLDSKKSYNVEFKLIAEPDAESKIYKVPLTLEYSDELGKKYYKNQTMGITIGAKPDLSITLDESDVIESSKAGEVVIKVVNKGVTNIKFMNIKIIPRNEYKILSNNEAYLGNIDSDDFETADFDVFVKKTDKESITIPFSVEYKDANNNNYKNIIELKLNLYTSSEAKKFGLKEENSFVGILIIIIIVLVGLWYYRKYRKKKKKT